MSEFIYGKNEVLAYLNTKGVVRNIFLMNTGKYPEIEEAAKKRKLQVQRVDKYVIDKKVKGVHQGVVAEIDGFKVYDLDTVIKEAKNKLIVMCDQIEDPHNLGAILRTADATGVDGVIIGKHRSVGLNSTVAKVSTGAIHTVKVAEVTNLVQAIKTLKDAGYWIVAAENGIEAIDYSYLSVDMPIVLVMGSEGKGISRVVKEASDILVTIPMLGSVNSLNVSVATGVILYDIVNRRG
ncbi:MAG: 23S rRNA (guanosine(2251)-2'-O)-methyltransferase RlmB [Erysipelothrix sp.]|nr:23S rRNA (guanosine(2251)-2'-O)-methyltransferase RlmB [Erysipelothrix sp.]